MIQWQDFLDILILWIIVYKLLLTARGSRFADLLTALSLLFLLSVFSKYLNLHTLHWIVESLWAYITIAVIVLFQPEIRRALAGLRKTGIMRFAPAVELKSMDEIIKATVSLSSRKIGAIIVIVRNSDPKDLIEIGTGLDARVSREIILSIFHPASPIHDGAVVIKGNRILSAGCFLPISLRHDIDKVLGTRHRAALAITEETDAVAVIVSEETGKISVAMAGRFDSDMDMTALRAVLSKIFT